ncbi:hypothetical protein ACI2LJ_26470 [Streptomyces sp. NPDC088090]
MTDKPLPRPAAGPYRSAAGGPQATTAGRRALPARHDAARVPSPARKGDA